MKDSQGSKPVYYQEVYGAVLDDTPESADWIKPKYVKQKPAAESVVSKTTAPPKEQTKPKPTGWYDDGIDPDEQLLKDRSAGKFKY